MPTWRKPLLASLAALIACSGLLAVPAALAQTSSPPSAGIETNVVIPGESTTEKAVGSFFHGTVTDLAQYIGLIYNFLISIVGVVAAVMMMIGGFQYLTAGGDAAKTGAARKRITNALAGLVLALASYLILNTISPSLVNLKVPQLPTIQREDTDYSKSVGSLCNQDSECDVKNGYRCITVEETSCQTALKYFAYISGGALAVAFLPEVIVIVKGVATTVRLAAQVAGRTIIAATQANGFTGGAAATGVITAGGVYTWDQIKTLAQGHRGICLKEAAGNVALGGLCVSDAACAPNPTTHVARKCLIDSGLNCIAGKAGYCSEGSTGDVCNTVSDCKSGLKCIYESGFLWGATIGRCSDQKENAMCNSDSDCSSGLKCKLVAVGIPKVCAKSEAVGIGRYCKTSPDCVGSTENSYTSTAEKPRTRCENPKGKMCDPSVDAYCICLIDPPNLETYKAAKDGYPCFTDSECFPNDTGLHCKPDQQFYDEQGVGTCH